MKYNYPDLSFQQFEDLIFFLCQELMGLGMQRFAAGPDGGRDGKFFGKAAQFPSKSEPWNGITIVQAKHTNGYNRSFSEKDFYSPSNKNSIVCAEIPRIISLREQKQIDNYILFSNRKLSGIAGSEITSYISAETGLQEKSIFLAGVETLENLLKRFPRVPLLADIDPIDSPLLVSADELAEIIQALAANKSKIKEAIENFPCSRFSYENKNVLNRMTKEFSDEWVKRYLKEVGQINDFLANPENSEMLKLYDSVVEEFQMNIIAKRKDYQTFDEIMIYLTRLLIERDPILRQNKRLVRLMLFYMYWSCDIGEVHRVTT